jgi:hypothetical protein
MLLKETATVKGKLGKKQNEMQRRDSRKTRENTTPADKTKHKRSNKQDKTKRTLEVCVADENAIENSGLYIQRWKGNFKTETTEFGLTSEHH